MKKLTIILITLALTMVGCGYGKPACSVVDAAEAACTVVRFMGDDGQVHEVKLTREELTATAKAKAKREAP